MSQKFIIESPDVQLSESCQDEIRTLASPLLNGPLNVNSLKLTIETDYSQSEKIIYTTRVLLGLRRSEIIAMAQADHLMIAIQLTFDDAKNQLVERVKMANATANS